MDQLPDVDWAYDNDACKQAVGSIITIPSLLIVTNGSLYTVIHKRTSRGGRGPSWTTGQLRNRAPKGGSYITRGSYVPLFKLHFMIFTECGNVLLKRRRLIN